MPDITYRESEIVAKQTIDKAYPSNGGAYVGRATAKMIESGKFTATLILTEVVES